MSKTLSEEIDFALCCISECCVDESKRNITSRKAVEQIREYLNVLNDDRYSKHFNISLKRELREKDQRIAELEKQLAEKDKMLENAIVPKFKVGQEVWVIGFIENKYGAFQEPISKTVTATIQRLDGFDYCELNEEGNFYCDLDVFATEQEAQQELKELEE